MEPDPNEIVQLTRRDFLVSTARGVGGLAFASLLDAEGLLAAEAKKSRPAPAGSLAVKPPHFIPKARQCIFLYMEGGVSQIDLFDPKPKLAELNGQKLPESLIKNVRFAFIQKEGAVVLGCQRKFKKHGQCGMELGEWLPHLAGCADDICLIRSMHTDTFNHHPGQLMMNTGVPTFGRPSMGCWVNYGLG